MSRRLHAALLVATLLFAIPLLAENPCKPANTVRADVVALDEAFFNNRLGTFQSGGMIFALRRDVVSNAGGYELYPGKVMLRTSKRPRPMVLRMNVGDCLQVDFQNLLADTQQVYATVPPPVWDGASKMVTANPNADPLKGYGAQFIQPPTRWAGVHVMGLQVVAAWDGNGTQLDSISGDGSWAGANDITANIATAMRASGMVRPGAKIRYLLYAPPQSEGSYLLYSTGATNGFQPTYGGQLMQGLFGSVTVQPKEGEYYRSQVTRNELWAATQKSAGKTLTPTAKTVKVHGQTAKVFQWNGLEVIVLDENGDPAASGGLHTTEAQPLIDYQATFPDGTPVLHMTKGSAPRELVYSDLTAIITGKDAGCVRYSPFADVPQMSKEERAASSRGNNSVCISPHDPVAPTPNAHQPWREFAIHYHDDFAATQPFPAFLNGNLSGVLTAGQDLFAINYGMGGIGAEIYANRIGVGPQHQCASCMYEEFFLSSWAVGDPAMVVDKPADFSPPPGPKATKALFPDDPSNVYHSYVGDHVIFQILHAGTNVTHVHHMHAQQWLHSPRNPNGAYRDSQMISPGASFTLNHVYNGSGNVNKTIGDSIFHCHFYPHFAQGMWSMWRVHDMFEQGTIVSRDGTVPGGWNRALPDGEIPYGTPTPALVPLPKLAMPLIPARVRLIPVKVADNGNNAVGFVTEVHPDDQRAGKNPGYPFFVPGVAGQRAPHPPLDFAWEEDANGKPKMDGGKKVLLDGGLPRHLTLWDTQIFEVHNRWDFTKLNHHLTTVELPEEGTAVEKIAMAFNGHRTGTKPFWPSFLPTGQPCNPGQPICTGFEVNGLPSKNGAPYANPNRKLNGGQQCHEEPEDMVPPVLDPEKGDQPCLIRYKAADIQIDAVFNKAGWHFPQTRLLSLWGDVKATEESKRMPEPFFFRANSKQIIEYWHTNLVPQFYELDDFQVRTPTDVIGQHIHLVKFDVTSSDGAGNGYNYEDGTFAAEFVREEIDATNQCPNGDCNQSCAGIFPMLTISGNVARPTGKQRCLTAKPIPYFGPGAGGAWIGAQTTIQRWSADPVIGTTNNVPYGADPKRRIDRTLRTVFTHDHFGPSTHQQAGLYAGLLVEPFRSYWIDGQTGVHYGSNQNRPLGADGRPPHDGGPTGWQANIVDRDYARNSYREFALEFADSQLAYTADSKGYLSPYDDGKNPNYTGWADPAHAIGAPGSPLGPRSCNAPANPSPPIPELITNIVPTGTYSVNYRNEPISLRVFSGAPTGTLHTDATDLSFAYASITRHAVPNSSTANLNEQPALGTPISTVNDFKYPGGFTGAHKTDPYTPLLRAYDGDSIQVRTLVGAHLSPHFFNFHGVNWLFEPQEEDSGYRSAQGMGISEHYEMIFRTPKSYGEHADYLYETTSDTLGRKNGNWGILRSYSGDQKDLVRLPKEATAGGPPAGCPSDATRRRYKVRAARIQDVTHDDALYYNTRGQAGKNGLQKLADPYAIVYVDEADLESDGKLKAGRVVEPLILRAAAGECVEISLYNALPLMTVGSANLTPTFTTSFSVKGADATEVQDWLKFLQPIVVGAAASYPTSFQLAFNNQNAFGYALPDSRDSTSITYNCVPGGCPDGVPTMPTNQCTTTIVITGTSAGKPQETFVVSRDFKDPTKLTVAAMEQVSAETSTQAGLHAALLQYDVRHSDGINVGLNPTQTAKPGQTVKYEWYAGRYEHDARTGKFDHFPIEYGSVNLNPSDPLLQHPKGLIGALIVEPIKAKWTTDANSKASANVSYTSGGRKRYFREFVAVIQDDVSLSQTTGDPKTPFTLANQQWSRAFNYKIEPMGYRYISPNFLTNNAANAPSGIIRAQSDQLTLSDPQTPVFVAAAGEAIRIRMLHPAGIDEQVLTLHGHSWEEEPYLVGKGGPFAAQPNGVASAIIGHNRLSQRLGSRDSFGPNVSWDLIIGEYEKDKEGKLRVVDGAGGVAKTKGDYMFRTFIGTDFLDGLWGLLRVGDIGKDVVTVTYYTNGSDSRFAAGVKGTVTANTTSGKVASKVEIWRGTSATTGNLVEIVNVNQNTGAWSSTANVNPPIFVRSACTANCTPIGPWDSITMNAFIPTTGDPKQETAATATAAPASTEEQTGTHGIVSQFRKDAPQPPPPPPQPPQPQP